METAARNPCCSAQPAIAPPTMGRTATAVRLQVLTLAWMLVECGVSLFAAARAHSPALLAFGSDSLIELLSAGLVLMQFTRARVPERMAHRAASLLLVALAVVVIAVGALGLAGHAHPDTSVAGIAIAAAALGMMPVLSWMKNREARRQGNAALRADAVQSATCAWLAALTLLGLGLNAAFHIGWFDSAAALLAVPILLYEARNAWRGAVCGCAG